MYRKRDNYSSKLKAMREARLKNIENCPAPHYPVMLPHLRRRIVIEDYDFGLVHHEINLYRTRRIDCYDMEVDGRHYADSIGWSSILEIIRKQFLRVRSG